MPEIDRAHEINLWKVSSSHDTTDTLEHKDDHPSSLSLSRRLHSPIAST
jgi:hypothetical protein